LLKYLQLRGYSFDVPGIYMEIGQYSAIAVKGRPAK